MEGFEHNLCIPCWLAFEADREARKRQAAEARWRVQMDTALLNVRVRLGEVLQQDPPSFDSPPGVRVEGLWQLVRAGDQDVRRLYAACKERAGGILPDEPQTLDQLTLLPSNVWVAASFAFEAVKLRPVPTIVAKAALRVRCAVSLVAEKPWRVYAVAAGQTVHTDVLPAGTAGVLRQPIEATVAVPVALPAPILMALATGEPEVPGANLLESGVRGAAWECGGQVVRLPPWQVAAFTDRPMSQSLDLLGVPEKLRPLLTPVAVPAPLPAPEEPPPLEPSPAQTEAVAMLVALDKSRWPEKRARQAVAHAAETLGLDASAKDLLRQALSS